MSSPGPDCAFERGGRAASSVEASSSDSTSAEVIFMFAIIAPSSRQATDKPLAVVAGLRKLWPSL